MTGRPLRTEESRFLCDYLAALQTAGIRYILLRNYEGFPAHIGHDLDVFIPRAALRHAERIFREILLRNEGTILITHERDYFLDIRFILHSPVSDAIHLDLFHGSYTWHGLAYLTEQKLLDHSRIHSGFPVPRPAHEALNLAFSSVLWGGFFKSRYAERIAQLLSEPGERTEFEACVRDAFGRADLPFNPAASTPPDAKLVRSLGRELRRQLKVSAFRRGSFGVLCCLARYWTKEISTLLRPKGLHIAILGPDGAGKSAVIDGLLARIGELFGEQRIHHWRPSILPDVGLLLGRRTKSDGPVRDPHGQKPHAAIVGFLRLLYYCLDYWLAYLPRILKPKAFVHLILFDRYADDMWCDQRRYRFALPGRLVKGLVQLTPRPDFTFVLMADAKTISGRKGELPDAAVEQVLQSYETLAQEDRRSIRIDATRPLNEVLTELETTIVAFLIRRENVQDT